VAGPDAVTRFAEQRIAAVEERYRERLAAAEPGVSPAQALAEALTEDGYVASTLPSNAGEQLCQHHCPVAHVAAQFPQLCEVETRTFSRLLGVHVQRLATIAHGDGVCTTHIPRMSPAPVEGRGFDKARPEPVEGLSPHKPERHIAR
jgi:predicted ArsR family transcriptional regulator